EVIENCDVLMILKIQHEIHEEFAGSKINYLEENGLKKERERKMQIHAIILHPGPVNRGVEIDTDLVECDKSRISKQIQNGVYIRMAIIIKQHIQWNIINQSHIRKTHPE